MRSVSRITEADFVVRLPNVLIFLTIWKDECFIYMAQTFGSETLVVSESRRKSQMSVLFELLD
jgi:hypothetical protein